MTTIELIGDKSVVQWDLPELPPDGTEFIAHDGRWYAATADRTKWQVHDGRPHDGAAIANRRSCFVRSTFRNQGTEATSGSEDHGGEVGQRTQAAEDVPAAGRPDVQGDQQPPVDQLQLRASDSDGAAAASGLAAMLAGVPHCPDCGYGLAKFGDFCPCRK